MNKSKDIKQIDPYLKIEEEVTIIDRSQLISITPEQAQKIKSLRIETQTIDNEFLLILDKNFCKKEFDYLSFKHCCFPCVTGIFCGLLVHNLEVIDCGLDEDDVYDNKRLSESIIISLKNCINNFGEVTSKNVNYYKEIFNVIKNIIFCRTIFSFI